MQCYNVRVRVSVGRQAKSGLVIRKRCSFFPQSPLFLKRRAKRRILSPCPASRVPEEDNNGICILPKGYQVLVLNFESELAPENQDFAVRGLMYVGSIMLEMKRWVDH
jgi:hypothetical protein